MVIVALVLKRLGVELGPDSAERIRGVVKASAEEIALASRLDVLHPEKPERPDQSLIDTRPYPRSHPHQKKDP